MWINIWKLLQFKRILDSISKLAKHNWYEMLKISLKLSSDNESFHFNINYLSFFFFFSTIYVFSTHNEKFKNVFMSKFGMVWIFLYIFPFRLIIIFLYTVAKFWITNNSKHTHPTDIKMNRILIILEVIILTFSKRILS